MKSEVLFPNYIFLNLKTKTSDVETSFINIYKVFTQRWRKLHNEELHGLYSSPSIVRVIKARRMRWAGHVERTGEVRGAYNILVGRPGGRRPLGRPRRRWEGNIKMDLREIGFGDVDWIHWAQDRDRWQALVNTVMTLRVP
jgi:hypothetical protein